MKLKIKLLHINWEKLLDIVIRYEEPKLLDSIGIKVAPQSYIYLRNK